MADSLLHAIEKRLLAARMTPSRFGRLAVNDPRLVFDLRSGRELRGPTEARVRAFLYIIAKENAPCER